MSSKITDIVNVGTNIATVIGLGIGTSLIMSNTNKAKKVIVVSSIAMSALAIGVSVMQTESIKDSIRKETLEVENKLRDTILRKG